MEKTMNKNIKPVAHQKITPVRIERDFNDVVVIEGVKYSGDFFRMNAMPSGDVLYAIHNNSDGVVIVTVIRNADEAKIFFDETGQGDPAPTEEQHAV